MSKNQQRKKFNRKKNYFNIYEVCLYYEWKMFLKNAVGIMKKKKTPVKTMKIMCMLCTLFIYRIFTFDLHFSSFSTFNIFKLLCGLRFRLLDYPECRICRDLRSLGFFVNRVQVICFKT